MNRLLCLAALVLAAPLAASAQTFPAPGTGAYTWDRVGNRPTDSRSFSFAPGGRLFAATDTVFVLDPAGLWRRVGRPDGFVDAVLALDPGGDTLFVGNGNGTVVTRTVDGGLTWAVVHGSETEPGIGGPKTPDGFFVVPAGHAHAGRLLAGGGILFSDDRGATWAEAARAFPGELGFAHVFAALPSGRVLMAGLWGVAASPDGGASYAVTPLYEDGRYQFNGLTPLATPGSRKAGAPSCGLLDGALCDGAVVVGTDASGLGVGAWRTADGGRTWSSPVRLPEPNDGVANGYTAGVVDVGPGPDGLGRAVAVLGRGVVYASRDGSQTWAAVGRLPVFDVGHRTRLVRLGPDGHLWVSTTINGPEREWLYRSAERAEAAFPVAGEAPPTSSGVGVSVRPNPAGGRVEVAVSLAEGGPVRVVVLDALGREVAIVLDGEAAPGERTVWVDVSSWPAGVYVVRATAGARVASARLVVVR